MIKIAIMCLTIGLYFFYKAISMNVAIPLEDGGYVNNIGLMSDRQNYFILAGFSILSSLVVFSIHQLGFKNQKNNMTTCPLCAEQILPEAVICKHCKTDLSKIKNAELLNEQELIKLIEEIKKKG